MSTSIQIRTYRATDLPTLVRLSNAERAGRGEPAAQTEERLQRHFDNFIFGFQPERDVFLALNGDEACGYAWTALNGEYNTGYISTTIDPAHGTSPTLERLQAVAEAHIRMTLGGDQLPPERPFFIDTFVSHDSNTEKMRCLAALGYNEVRRFYDMLIQLEGELQPATIPPGLELRPFQRKTEASAYHAAYLECFHDHWGNISIEEFERFDKFFDNPEFDAALWFAAWDGEEIAGVMFGERSRAHPQRGVVDLLGVRRPWRRRGLGMALLLQAFYVFQQYGLSEVELEVDAESRTNAVALYERAGMQVTSEHIVFRKMIWGRPEDIVE